LGGKLLGWRTVCAVELDAYCRRVLLARQRDGFLPRFPIWDDVQTFDGKPWRGHIDVVSGGFPCQDISASGKGAGIEGERSGMWREMARIIGEVGPRYAFVENSPMLAIRGGLRVISDFASLGYSCQWGVVGACHAAAPHKRNRMWIFANRAEVGQHRNRQDQICRFATNAAWQGYRRLEDVIDRPPIHSPRFCRVDDGVAHRVERVSSIGNGQVPAVAALAWRLLGGPSR
jgi:DNA (cytosine-5)-methyltransferase 1